MSAGDILAQSGQNMVNNMEMYRNIQNADAAAQGQINAYLGTDPTGANLSPDGQALIEKQMAGKASYQDRIRLMGEITTAQTLRQNQLKMAMDRLNYNRLAYYSPGGPGFLGAPQPDQPTQLPIAPPNGATQGQLSPAAAQMIAQNVAPPAPVVGNVINPPSPVTLTSPEIIKNLPRYMSMTMGDVDKASALAQKDAEAINKAKQAQYDQAVAVKKPSGRLVYMGSTYENGVPVKDNYSPEMITAPGTPVQSYDIGPQSVYYPHGTKPPSPVVFKAGENTANGPAPSQDAQSTISSVSPFNPADSTVQKNIVDATGNVAQLQGRVAEAQLLKRAAQAYASGGSSAFNALRGDPRFAKLQQLWTGNNPQAALRTALSANTSSILSQIKNPNGTTTGGRVLQSEFEGMSKLLGDPEMDNLSLLAATYNNADLMQRMLDIENAKATYLHQMPQGDAEALALKQFGGVPQLASAGKVQNIPKAKVQQLKSMLQAKYPGAIEFFKQKFGVSDKEAEIAILANAQ